MEYTQGTLYLNGVERGDQVLIVDDLISTGGTLVALIRAVRQAGAHIRDVVCVAEKIEYGGGARVQAETGLAVKTLVKISVAGERSRVVG
jgi:adenine/guanine phosphoribosyltransferase-like PRPP-binding protein